MLTLCFAFSAVVHAAEWWNESTLDNARSLALLFDRESRRHFSYREGHIAMSDKALEMYFEIARQPNVKTICETGFNAGHSAAVFLVANPQARVISFDLGQFQYTHSTLRLMAELFPDRFEYLLGDSFYSLPQAIEKFGDSLTCDIISVDGTHTTDGTYADLKNFAKIASCRNWVLMDDAGFRDTNTAWQRAKDDGFLTQFHCFADLDPTTHWLFLSKPENRSWCLGWFNRHDELGEGKCPRWFLKNQTVNSNETKITPLIFY